MYARMDTDPVLLMGKQGLRSQNWARNQGGTLGEPQALGVESKAEPAGRPGCSPVQQPGRASRESVSSGVLPCVGSRDPPLG